jgi:hypothetical protein
MLNQNIVHLIDDIFWNMGFKTETQADKVMHIIPIASIISIISLIRDIPIARIISIVSFIRGICESPRDKVMHIISIIRIISIILIILIILIMRIICRFVRILDLRITCGRTRGQQSPSPLITWAISFVLPCVLDGFHTSVVPTQRMPRTMLAALLWEKASSWSQNESTPLLDATNNVPP